jgi:hypothetical protein
MALKIKAVTHIATCPDLKSLINIFCKTPLKKNSSPTAGRIAMIKRFKIIMAKEGANNA